METLLKIYNSIKNIISPQSSSITEGSQGAVQNEIASTGIGEVLETALSTDVIDILPSVDAGGIDGSTTASEADGGSDGDGGGE